MQECLAIKPDLIFLWDEAWFAFARFHPVYRPRTALRAARTLAQTLRQPEYQQRYADFAAEVGAIDAADDEVLLSRQLLPDPARARVRVYSTQSTHKTLTSLRQGSMIHVWDQDFSQKVEETFHEAYMTHTSTSPNYQILASLDLGAGRRRWRASSWCKSRSRTPCACAMRWTTTRCCPSTCTA